MGEGGSGKGEEGKTPGAPVTGSPNLTVFYLIVLFGLMKFPETLLLLRLQDIGAPVAATPLAWAGLHVIRTSTSYSGGRLSDRFGTGLTMSGGWIVYAVACAGLALAGSVATGFAWFLSFGLVSSLTESPERAFVANLKARMGTGSRFGAYHAATGVAALIGGLLFGFVYSRFGGPAALMASGVGTGFLVVTAAFRGKREGGWGMGE